MGIFRTSSDLTVRPFHGWSERGWSLGLVFVLAALAVFLGGRAASGPGQPETDPGATATVSVQLDQGEPEDGSAVDVLGEAPWSWIAGSRQEVTSEANLADVVRELGIAVPAQERDSHEELIERSLDQIRHGFEVEAAPGPGPEGTRIRFDYRGPTPGYSALLVNRLAAELADSLRASWKVRAQRAHAQAREELERAQTASRQAAVAVEVLLEERFRKAGAGSRSDEADLSSGELSSVPAQGTEPPDHPTSPEPPAPRTVENPDWLVVFDQLEDLKRRHAELLLTRTELHPLVQDTADRIGALERQLAAIPRAIVVEAPQEPAPAPCPQPTNGPAMNGPATANRSPAERVDPADVEALGKLKSAAQAASEQRRLAALAERAAWKQCRREPKIEVEPAEFRPPASPNGVGFGWLLASLASGLATAVGVGLASTGLAMERPLDSVERIEAVSGGPVVAVIPRTGPDTEAPAVPRYRPVLKASLIVAGVLLVAGCAGVVVRALV